MKTSTLFTKIVALSLAVLFPLTGAAQFGGLGGIAKQATGGGGGAAVDGAGFLKQLTPGAVKFTKAYSLYFEALGDSERAAKLKLAAEQLETGGVVTKDHQKVMDQALKDLTALNKKKDALGEAAKAKYKEANAMYLEGLAEWGVVSALVSTAIAQDPKAALTNPELGLAAAMCVKGIKDLSGYIKVAQARSDDNNEQKKASK